MGYERGDRRYGRDLSYGYRPGGRDADRERGYAQGEDLSYNRDRGYDRGSGRDVDYGRRPAEYDRDDRGFLDRAGDEVRSWFGDEEAERRRRWDEREAERDEYRNRDRYGRDYGRETSGRSIAERDSYGTASGIASAGYGWQFRDRADADRSNSGRNRDHDPHYREWRDRQIESLDRDYDEYRREHQSRFDTEFHGWRERRQGQRQSLRQVQEHQEVVGSDGQHVGKVDHVKGDRILLAKSDKDAGGHHHSIPCSWIKEVGDKVTIDRTAADAHKAWKDEEQSAVKWGDRERQRDEGDGSGPHNLNRSFSGTY